jgi:hypothetical protein
MVACSVVQNNIGFLGFLSSGPGPDWSSVVVVHEWFRIPVDGHLSDYWISVGPRQAMQVAATTCNCSCCAATSRYLGAAIQSKLHQAVH